MTILAHIDNLVWDRWNLEHIARHDVTKDEIDAVVQPDFAPKESCKGRVVITGSTMNGRIRSVVAGQSPNQNGFAFSLSHSPSQSEGTARTRRMETTMSAPRQPRPTVDVGYPSETRGRTSSFNSIREEAE